MTEYQKQKSIKCKQLVNISNTVVDSNNMNDHRDNSETAFCHEVFMA